MASSYVQFSTRCVILSIILMNKGRFCVHGLLSTEHDDVTREMMQVQVRCFELITCVCCQVQVLYGIWYIYITFRGNLTN